MPHTTPPHPQAPFFDLRLVYPSGMSLPRRDHQNAEDFLAAGQRVPVNLIGIGIYSPVMAPRQTNKPVKFEDAIQQIEAVIDRIESGEVGLEQSLVEYEQATKLIGRCRSILNTAQQRIDRLTTNAQGQLEVTGETAPDPGPSPDR